MPILRLLQIFFILFGYYFKAAAANRISLLPKELLIEIAEYLGEDHLVGLRGSSPAFKLIIEDYLKMAWMKDFWIDHVRTWQLRQILRSKEAMTITRLLNHLFHPQNACNHLKLIKFMAAHAEFDEMMDGLRTDVNGFILPFIAYYERRIHGLDDFVQIFRCERHLKTKNLIENGNGMLWCLFGDEFNGIILLLDFIKLIQG